MDTIYALSTARGKAGVAIVRISGPDALTALEQLAGPAPTFRTASLRKIRAAGRELIDQALVLTFPESGSFTGELVAELHVHGSTAIVTMVLDALSAIGGLRPADAGEFTRRALENDRLDLAQVEGLADLIEAETTAQHKQAMRLFEGALGGMAEGWRRRLLRAAALIEATIDFADEEVPVDLRPEVTALLLELCSEIEREISGSRIAERIRDGFEVAIVGPPNAGKSTLLNRLAGRDAAITSALAGTTRDVIEVRMDLAGLPVTLLDTAGLRDAADEIEGIGIARARARAKASDLKVILLEGPDASPVMTPEGDDIVALPKADLHGSNGPMPFSALTGVGVERLISAIARVLEGRASLSGTATNVRHRDAMKT
ncbi:MAG: tRNA uridine-5-carboxymethylaminomethyl(34) synthesis GTPase MnmE, partial [Pseudomonadota bacterium]